LFAQIYVRINARTCLVEEMDRKVGAVSAVGIIPMGHNQDQIRLGQPLSTFA
jgi:hypothetical protein